MKIQNSRDGKRFKIAGMGKDSKKQGWEKIQINRDR